MTAPDLDRGDPTPDSPYRPATDRQRADYYAGLLADAVAWVDLDDDERHHADGQDWHRVGCDLMADRAAQARAAVAVEGAS